VGDVAKIADVAGLVEEINLRRSVLRDLDGIVRSRVFDEGGIEIPWPHTKVYFGGPLEQQMARAVERKPPKQEEVPHEIKPTEEVLPPESEGGWQ